MNFRTIIVNLNLFICLPIGTEYVAGQKPKDSIYLGQKSPDLMPEKFMPGVISTDDHFEFIFTMSPDGKEILFTRRIDKADVVMISSQDSTGWSDPKPFALLNSIRAFEQHISPNCDRIFFSRISPPPGVKMEGPPKTREEEAMMVGVWYIDRTDTEWSEPVYCTHGMYVTTASDGTIYTTDIRGPVGISCSRLIDGKYSALKMLGGGVNDPVPGAHPCIAQDESFIVFDSEREGGYGKTDLYVCFRRDDGTWGEAINLGENINTEGTDFCPSLSPDGRYLFFASKGDVYWVDVNAVRRLKQQ